MRPKMFYAAYADARVFGVFHGAAAARKALGDWSRNYTAFKTQLEAEEFAAWYNYERDLYDDLARRTRDRERAVRTQRIRADNRPYERAAMLKMHRERAEWLIRRQGYDGARSPFSAQPIG